MQVINPTGAPQLSPQNLPWARDPPPTRQSNVLHRPAPSAWGRATRPSPYWFPCNGTPQEIPRWPPPIRSSCHYQLYRRTQPHSTLLPLYCIIVVHIYLLDLHSATALELSPPRIRSATATAPETRDSGSCIGIRVPSGLYDMLCGGDIPPMQGFLSTLPGDQDNYMQESLLMGRLTQPGEQSAQKERHGGEEEDKKEKGKETENHKTATPPLHHHHSPPPRIPKSPGTHHTPGH